MGRFVKMVNDCNNHQLFLQNSPSQMFDRILNTSLGFLLLEIKSQTLSYVVTAMVRSSRPGVFCKKEVLTKLAKLIEKHLCQSLFLIKKLWQRCFPVNFAKVLRKTFLIEHLRRLLPNGMILRSFQCQSFPFLTRILFYTICILNCELSPTFNLLVIFKNIFCCL